MVLITCEVPYSMFGAIVLPVWSVQFNATPHALSKLWFAHVPQYTILLFLVMRGIEDNSFAQVCAFWDEGRWFGVPTSTVGVTAVWRARLYTLMANRILYVCVCKCVCKRACSQTIQRRC